MIIPKPVRETLGKLQTQFPEAVIAGGFLRDLRLGVTPKDIDVFVWTRGSMTEVALTRALGETVIRMDPEFANKYAENFSELDAVYDAPSVSLDDDDLFPSSHQLQIIALTRPFDISAVLDRFDFGVCQAAYDGKLLAMTDAFMADVENRTFTLVREPKNIRDLTRSIERFERISPRMPLTWTLVNPYTASMLPS